MIHAPIGVNTFSHLQSRPRTCTSSTPSLSNSSCIIRRSVGQELQWSPSLSHPRSRQISVLRMTNPDWLPHTSGLWQQRKHVDKQATWNTESKPQYRDLVHDIDVVQISKANSLQNIGRGCLFYSTYDLLTHDFHGPNMPDEVWMLFRSSLPSIIAC